jgi:probable rRNA maturation factor
VNLVIDIQSSSGEPSPGEDDIRRWVSAALEGRREDAEVSVCLVDEDTMTGLNSRYRGKDSSTNVLSFPAELPPGVEHPLLGDIVLCAAVINREAREQHKSPEAHWSHMLVHGSLHLLGYDHVDPREAEAMEALETGILSGLGYACPYATEELAEVGR